MIFPTVKFGMDHTIVQTASYFLIFGNWKNFPQLLHVMPGTKKWMW